MHTSLYMWLSRAGVAKLFGRMTASCHDPAVTTGAWAPPGSGLCCLTAILSWEQPPLTLMGPSSDHWTCSLLYSSFVDWAENLQNPHICRSASAGHSKFTWNPGGSMTDGARSFLPTDCLCWASRVMHSLRRWHHLFRSSSACPPLLSGCDISHWLQAKNGYTTWDVCVWDLARNNMADAYRFVLFFNFSLHISSPPFSVLSALKKGCRGKKNEKGRGGQSQSLIYN